MSRRILLFAYIASFADGRRVQTSLGNLHDGGLHTDRPTSVSSLWNGTEQPTLDARKLHPEIGEYNPLVELKAVLLSFNPSVAFNPFRLSGAPIVNSNQIDSRPMLDPLNRFGHQSPVNFSFDRVDMVPSASENLVDASHSGQLRPGVADVPLTDTDHRHQIPDQEFSPDPLRLILQDLQMKVLLVLAAIFAGIRAPDLWQAVRRRVATKGVQQTLQAAAPQLDAASSLRSRCPAPQASAPDTDATHHNKDAPPPSFLELLKFTVFAMPIYVSPTLLSLIDTAVVGQISSTQLAALGPACAICDSLTGLMVFISIGTTNALSTALGNGDRAEGKRVASVSVLLAFLIGCVVAVLLYGSIGPIIAKYALPGALSSTMARTGGSAAAAAATTQLWSSCETYVKIRALSFPAALVLMASQAACLGTKDSTSPTLATLLASVVNIVGDVVLVLGPLAMGIAGAAWATVGCQIVAAAALLFTLRRKQLIDIKSLLTLPSRSEVKRFFAFAGFIFVLFTKQIVYNQAVVLASILGTAAGAAHQCLYSLFRLCCTLGDVTGATAQAFLPRFYVTDEETGKVSFDAAAARGTMQRIVGMTAIVAVCNTAITFSVPLLKPGLFTADKEVIALFRRAAPLAAFGLLMHPSVVGMEGCLLATKDLRWLVTNYATTGALSVLATYLLLNLSQFRSMLSMNTIWIYLAVYQVVRFVTFVWRLLSNTIASKDSSRKS